MVYYGYIYIVIYISTHALPSVIISTIWFPMILWLPSGKHRKDYGKMPLNHHRISYISHIFPWYYGYVKFPIGFHISLKQKHEIFREFDFRIQVWDHGRGGRLLGRRREDQCAFALREKTAVGSVFEGKRRDKNSGIWEPSGKWTIVINLSDGN